MHLTISLTLPPNPNVTSLLLGLGSAALLSLTSLLILLFRVSPLTAPSQAIPAFFLSLLLSVSTVGSLLLLGLWKMLPTHTWDSGKVVSVSLREGIFLGLAIAILTGFFLLELLTWWIVALVILVFGLIELALNQ